MTRCGGTLHPAKLGRVGERVPCPTCGKPVKLRRPFNGCNTGWVQVPQHKRADAKWCEKCGVDVYLDGKCCAFGCGHIKGTPIDGVAGTSKASDETRNSEGASE